ncbi:hypothetical protein N9H35_00665 [bacterium]|nr:hypothetical protein [bacterium]
MSILIITNPRSGSTALLTTLAKCLGYRAVHEPLNPILKHPQIQVIPQLDYSDIDFDNISKDDKLIVKCMTHQYPETSDAYSYFLKFAKQFQHVIILSRRDINAQATSYAIAQKRSKLSGKNDFQTQYSSDYSVSQSEIDAKINFYVNEKTKIELLSLDLNINITWYEDVFSSYSSVRLKQLGEIRNIDDFNEKVYINRTNPNHRLRKDSNNRSII